MTTDGMCPMPEIFPLRPSQAPKCHSRYVKRQRYRPMPATHRPDRHYEQTTDVLVTSASQWRGWTQPTQVVPVNAIGRQVGVLSR